LELPEESTLWQTQQLFMFCFYTIGMPWSDMANLKLKSIIGKRIRYKRNKTKKEFSIEVNDKIKPILEHYSINKKKNDYIFPIILRESIEEQRKDIKNKLKTYNKYIRLIASDLEIEGNITSYVARHSWASIGKFLNVPVQVISEGLGHDSIQTTQIYLESFEANVIDDATKLITG